MNPSMEGGLMANKNNLGESGEVSVNEEGITSRRYLSDAGEISSKDTGSEITTY